MLKRRDRCAHCSSTKRSTEMSCCARGGAWFKNCGDFGDMTFDHTWAEGIQACKGFGKSVLLPSSLQLPSHHVRVIDLRLNTFRSRNTTQRQTNLYSPDSVFNTDKTNSQECDQLMKVVVYIHVLLIIQHSQAGF